ncbi:hypothetical protein JCM10207_006904 [Rhodosporidiobolus poonsookiae]
MAAVLPPLTVYSARICPWAQRMTLALREVGAYRNGQVQHVEIDLQNKPDWYASKVNPASKVPVLQVGKEGDADTLFIPESGVLLELVADLFPESELSPKDPVKRAYARYFSQRFLDIAASPINNILLFSQNEQIPALLTGIEEVQTLLARFPGTFLLGEQISIGDLAVAPFIGRLFAAGKAGTLSEEAYKPLSTESKYEPFRAYHKALTSRPSWAETFDEQLVLDLQKRIRQMRAEGKL